MPKLFVTISVVISMLIVFVPMASYLFFWSVHVKPKLAEIVKPLDSKVRSRMLTDLKQLEKQPLFEKPFTYSKNAETFLTQHIPVESGDEPSKTKIDASHVKVKALFEKYQNQPIKDRVLGVKKDLASSSIELEWMKQLSEFDHWNFESHPQFKQAQKDLENANSLKVIEFTASYGLPNYMLLLHYGIIRFLSTVEQDVEMAYSDYHKVLRLVASDSSLIGHMVAASGVSYGSAFKSLYPVKGFEFYNMKTRNAFKRVSWAWTSFPTLVFARPLDPEFEPYLKPEFGICGQARESSGFSWMPELSKDSAWPFEQNFTDEMAREVAFKKKLLKICGQTFFASLLDRPIARLSAKEALTTRSLFSVDEQAERDPQNIPDIDIGSIPYLRRAIWGVLVTIAVPSFMGLYDDDRYLADEKQAAESNL
ncbi:MAG: hypothetical protein HRT45_12770 [Bdellovibrionales bacterium]|nr:hypothetical protein [Bdellovibrionales bacterium]